MQQMVARRRIGGALASAAALVALAGCAGAEPSVVAYVGDDRITQAQLDQAMAGLATTLEEGRRVDRDAVVGALIHGVLAEQIAEANNISVTDTERETLLKGSALAGLLNEPDAKGLAYDVADDRIVAEKLGAEKYLGALKSSSVTLNPRFGVLDPDQKLITSPEQTGSLSSPAPLPVEQP